MRGKSFLSRYETELSGVFDHKEPQSREKSKVGSKPETSVKVQQWPHSHSPSAIKSL